MNLHEIIEEISQLKNPSAHKAALDIYNLLENNRALFKGKIDESDFKGLLVGFEALAFASPKEYAAESYTSDYERMKGLLSYHLNKIL
jgi:hypothetical protein